MGRIQGSEKTFVNIVENENGRPSFSIQGTHYATVFGELTGIKTEKKNITPKSGPNMGKEVTVHNLMIEIQEDDGTDLMLTLPLYSSLARNVINGLAGVDPLGDVFISIYKNKAGYKCISVKKSKNKDDYYTPYYTFDQEQSMVQTVVIRGETKKDYDAVSDKYVKELIPIIQGKINSYVPQEDNSDEGLPFGDEETATPISDSMRASAAYDDNDDLPF